MFHSFTYSFIIFAAVAWLIQYHVFQKVYVFHHVIMKNIFFKLDS